MDKSGGFWQKVTGVISPNRRGVARTEVSNPLQKEEGTSYTKDADDCSRALTPKQDGQPQ